MVTNSTNICKTNSHLSPKLIEDNKKKTTTYDVGNPGSGLWHAQQWGGVKPGNRILIPSLNIWSIEYHNVHLELYHRDMNIWIQGLILKSNFYLFFSTNKNDHTDWCFDVFWLCLSSSCVLCTLCCQCLWIVHCDWPFGIL
jgi:hypothetical protein